MKLYGRDYGFRLTVGAACELAQRCPGGELKNVMELVRGPLVSATEGRTALICALSRGCEEARSFEEPGYQPSPLTPELLRTLDPATFAAVFAEAMTAFTGDAKTEVEIENAKKNGASAATASP